MQQAELYRNRIFRAYEKRVQPSIFVCEFLDPGNLVLRVTDKVDYPGWPPVLSSGFFPDHSAFSQPSIGRTPLSHTQRRFQARWVVYSRLNIDEIPHLIPIVPIVLECTLHRKSRRLKDPPLNKAFRLGDIKGEPRLASLSLYYSTHLSTYLVQSRRNIKILCFEGLEKIQSTCWSSS